MALKKTINTKHGIDVNDAYHRVESVQLREKTQLMFAVRSYADPSKQAIDEKIVSCAYNLNGDNPIKQAYEHLKTLPEFAGAADV